MPMKPAPTTTAREPWLGRGDDAGGVFDDPQGEDVGQVRAGDLQGTGLAAAGQEQGVIAHAAAPVLKVMVLAAASTSVTRWSKRISMSWSR